MNEYVAGSTSIVDLIYLQDSTSTTGGGKTGLAYNTASLTCYYKRSNGTASVAVTLANITTLGTFVSGGFKEIDATNMPGCYEFHPPNAAFASGAKEVTFFFTGAAGLVQRPIKYRILGGLNVDSGTNAGLSALPTVNPGASGGVLISGTNTGTTTLDSLVVTGATVYTGNVSMAAGLTITQSTTDGYGISIAGNGNGDGIFIVSGLGGATSGNGITISSNSINGYGIAALATGSTNAYKISANLAGSVASISVNGIDANSIATDAIGSAELASAAADKIADAILARNITGGSSTGRTVKQALAKLRNKWDIYSNAGVPTMRIYATDDTTVLWEEALSTSTYISDVVTGADPA